MVFSSKAIEVVDIDNTHEQGGWLPSRLQERGRERNDVQVDTNSSCH